MNAISVILGRVSLHPDTYEYLDRQRDARDHERTAAGILADHRRLGTFLGTHWRRQWHAELAEARFTRARERARFARSYTRRWQAARGGAA